MSRSHTHMHGHETKNLRTSFFPNRGFTVLLMVSFWLSYSPASAQKWKPVLVDKMGTDWSVDTSHDHKAGNQIEIWVKKSYDQARMAESFRRYRVGPSAYDVERWALLPDKKITLIQAARYSADGKVLDSFEYLENGKHPTRAFPPGSAMDTIWKYVYQAPHSPKCGVAGKRAPFPPNHHSDGRKQS